MTAIADKKAVSLIAKDSTSDAGLMWGLGGNQKVRDKQSSDREFVVKREVINKN